MNQKNHHFFFNSAFFHSGLIAGIRPNHQVSQNRENWKRTVWRSLDHSFISLAIMPRISVWWRWTTLDIQRE